MLNADDLSRLYDIRDITGKSGTKIVCPIPDHKHINYTPSFSIFFDGGKQRWHCHGCGRRGDVIDLVGYMNIPGYNLQDPEHLKSAIYTLTGGEFSSAPVVPPPPKPIGLYQGEWKKYCPPGSEVFDYAKKRGISRAVLNRFHIGQVSLYGKIYMTIPCFHDGILRGIKLRLVVGEGTRYLGMSGSRSGLFNHDGISLQNGTTFLVNGEIGAMVMESFGYTACAPTSGECGDISELATALSAAKKIVIISDNDDREKTHKQIAACAQKRARLLNAKLIYPDHRFKDIDEWLLAEPEAAKNYLDTFLGGTNESFIYRWQTANPKQSERCRA